MFCLHRIYLSTGSLELILKISYEYNHILPFLAAVGLFMTFVMTDVSGVIAKIGKRIGPYTLGVYLLHENLGVRNAWPDWLGADKITGVGSLLVRVLTAAVIVFVAGILIDWIRSLLMGGLHKLLCKVALYRKLVAKLETNYDGI
jgi:surface polysaccharide O-acyltransferase-like enzyme